MNCAAKLTEGDIELLQSYDWRGNVRELQHAIERAAILSQGGRLQFDGVGGKEIRADVISDEMKVEQALLTKEQLKQRERQNLIAALEKSGGKIYGAGGAAELLNMRPTTLASRMRALQIGKAGKS